MDTVELDPINMAGNKAKGQRPEYFSNPNMDRLMSILLAVSGELAVTRERLDTLERILQSKGNVSQQEIDSYEPDPVAAKQRGLWHQEFIARILRVLQQEIEALHEAPDTADKPATKSSGKPQERSAKSSPAQNPQSSSHGESFEDIIAELAES